MERKRFNEVISDMGFIKLGNITLTLASEEQMQLVVDILDMSDKLKMEIENNVEEAKLKYTKEWDDWYKKQSTEVTRFKRIWSDEPVRFYYHYLNIDLEEGKPIHYTVIAVFSDKKDETMETDIEIDVDLSAYNNELREEVTSLIVGKFFQ